MDEHDDMIATTAERLLASRPFLVVAALGILAGGLASAVGAHNPQRFVMWVSAYLVLVVGVVQAVFGAGQAWLTHRVPSRGLCWLQCALFNLGSVGVIASQALARHWLVYPGTLLFAAAMGLFLVGTRHGRHARWLWAYRVMIALIGASSLVGIVLSWMLHAQ